jgi:phospho-2-dehydro-3-deoxyheptonate aldolase
LKPEPENSITLFHIAPVSDLRVLKNAILPLADSLMREIAPSAEEAQLVGDSRTEIQISLFVHGSRFMFIVGPCSIHDT